MTTNKLWEIIQRLNRTTDEKELELIFGEKMDINSIINKYNPAELDRMVSNYDARYAFVSGEEVSLHGLKCVVTCPSDVDGKAHLVSEKEGMVLITEKYNLEKTGKRFEFPWNSTSEGLGKTIAAGFEQGIKEEPKTEDELETEEEPIMNPPVVEEEKPLPKPTPVDEDIDPFDLFC